MSELHYGKNVEWFLRELSAHEAGDIESAEIEVIGENDQGVEGSATIDITLLAADAVTMIAALQQKLDAVAAENVALKGFGNKLNDMHNNLNGEGTGIQGRAEVACQQVALEAAMEEFDAIKTPATDALLNTVRADAIDEFGRYHNFSGKLLIQQEAKKYAAKLRAETNTTPSQYESLAGGK
ncbi:hypothetical protein QM543_07220 [Pantoea eucrina]|uniref:hypothetical protein n=1 Tax=Pantoea eucrina TaxID=472693 RepID=UPI0024B67D58|nr:hypothetical protein [Pantoea eucrina]MDJ0023071.1 hypothetical protein [Pantoea eucrina]